MPKLPAASPVDWSRVDTALLDMDGTLLDLNFDNRFWLEHLPRHYAEARAMSIEAARAYLEPLFMTWRGKLEWYSVDHWSRELALDISTLKNQYAHLIAILPGVEDFLRAVRASGRSLWLVTNAHPASLELKMARTRLGPAFDLVLSSHAFGYPKEDARFWPALIGKHSFDPARALMVDDSLPVLAAAKEFGVGQVCAISRPDTNQPQREVRDFPSAYGLAEIKP